MSCVDFQLTAKYHPTGYTVGINLVRNLHMALSLVINYFRIKITIKDMESFRY